MELFLFMFIIWLGWWIWWNQKKGEDKKMKKIFILILLVLLFGLFSSCSFTDMKIRKGISNQQIRIGSSRDEVAKITGYPWSYCIKKRVKSDGNYEMWDFASRGCSGANLTESYVFIFKNNELIEIRTVSNVFDLQL